MYLSRQRPHGTILVATLHPHSHLTPQRRPQQSMPVHTTSTRKHHGTLPKLGRILMSPKRRQHPHTISLPLPTPDPDASSPSNSEHTRPQPVAEHVPCTGQLTKPPGSPSCTPDACHPILPRSRPPPTFSHRHLNPTSTIAQLRLTSAITRPPFVAWRSQRVSQLLYLDSPDFTLVQLRQQRYTPRLRDCHAPRPASRNNSAGSHCPKCAERCARIAPDIQRLTMTPS